MAGGLFVSGIIPNNCDEDIPVSYSASNRGPSQIDDVSVSILEQTEDYVMINKPVFAINFRIF
jgi:hypothetical protein